MTPKGEPKLLYVGKVNSIVTVLNVYVVIYIYILFIYSAANSDSSIESAAEMLEICIYLLV